MRWVIDDVMIAIGIGAGFLLFVFGIRREFKERNGRSVWDKIVIAASLTILSMAANSYADEKNDAKQSEMKNEKEAKEQKIPVENENKDKPKASDEEIQLEKAIDKRVEEITAMPEWKRIRKIWVKLSRLMKAEEELPENISDWRYEEMDATKGQFNKIKEKENNEAILSKEEGLYLIKRYTMQYANHVAMSYGVENGFHIECYRRCPDSSVKTFKPTVKDLLEKQFQSGKILKDVYEKVMIFLSVDGDQGFKFEILNRTNRILVSKLLKEISSPLIIDISKITPEVSKKIDSLIAGLGNDDWKVRDQSENDLIAIGEMAIPQLIEALKSEDVEIRDRAIKILSELGG